MPGAAIMCTVDVRGKFDDFETSMRTDDVRSSDIPREASVWHCSALKFLLLFLPDVSHQY